MRVSSLRIRLFNCPFVFSDSRDDVDFDTEGIGSEATSSLEGDALESDAQLLSALDPILPRVSMNNLSPHGAQFVRTARGCTCGESEYYATYRLFEPSEQTKSGGSSLAATTIRCEHPTTCTCEFDNKIDGGVTNNKCDAAIAPPPHLFIPIAPCGRCSGRPFSPMSLSAALDTAISHGRLDAAYLLIAHLGADVNAQPQHNTFSPATMAPKYTGNETNGECVQTSLFDAPRTATDFADCDPSSSGSCEEGTRTCTLISSSPHAASVASRLISAISLHHCAPSGQLILLTSVIDAGADLRSFGRFSLGELTDEGTVDDGYDDVDLYRWVGPEEIRIGMRGRACDCGLRRHHHQQHQHQKEFVCVNSGSSSLNECVRCEPTFSDNFLVRIIAGGDLSPFIVWFLLRKLVKFGVLGHLLADHEYCL